MKTKTSNRLARKEAVYHSLIRNHIFNDYCYDGDLNKIRKQINSYRGVLVKYLYCLRNSDNIHYRDQKKWKKRHGFYKCSDDNRSGFETYGYEDLESINLNLSYIADRFGGEFRIQWMLDLEEGIKQLEK